MKPKATLSPAAEIAAIIYKIRKEALAEAQELLDDAHRELVEATFADQHIADIRGSKTVTFPVIQEKITFSFTENVRIDRDVFDSVLKQVDPKGTLGIFKYKAELVNATYKELTDKQKLTLSEAVTFKAAKVGITIK